MSRYLKVFDEDTILKVIIAYLYEGKSHRQIQREILNLPAPAHGGGFIVMDILHYYGINGEKKGFLIDHDMSEILKISDGNLHDVLSKVNEYRTFEKQVETNIIHGEFRVNNENTEISVQTKHRINQSVLRNYILKLYNHECALCNINKTDLLVCSHIKPWNIDEENRLNPSNAICFCVLHDKLFDKGYFSLDNNYNVIFSSKADSQIKDLFKGIKFKLPSHYKPDKKLLEYHYCEICR